MKKLNYLLVFLLSFYLAPRSYAETKKIKFLIADSYHKEYTWSQDTNNGFCDAMLKSGYFDSKDQIDEFSKNDHAESSKAVIKKLWLDAKRKSGKGEKDTSSFEIYKIIMEYKPDIILLGDDDAAEWIGSKLKDTEIPVVFWGVNNTPVKYGLVDSIDKPGHNITGVYEAGYYVESLQLLKNIAPRVKTFAILADASTVCRSHIKEIEYLDREGKLPVKLSGAIATDSFEDWKNKALELQKKVDAFFVVGYSGMKDGKGNVISDYEAAEWYINNIKIPEASRGHRVRHGMLCAADDPGYNQSYEAVMIAHDILANGKTPKDYPPRAPERGKLMANKKRAEILGITLTKDMGIEEYFEAADALKADDKK